MTKGHRRCGENMLENLLMQTREQIGFIPEEKGYSVKIEDPLKRYPTTTVPVFNTNLYVLCTTKVKSFGPKMTNNMITIEMSK